MSPAGKKLLLQLRSKMSVTTLPVVDLPLQMRNDSLLALEVLPELTDKAGTVQ